MSYRQIAAGVITCLLSSGIIQAQKVQNKRETQVRQDKSVFEEERRVLICVQGKPVFRPFQNSLDFFVLLHQGKRTSQENKIPNFRILKIRDDSCF